jgi:hypothetical protein
MKTVKSLINTIRSFLKKEVKIKYLTGDNRSIITSIVCLVLAFTTGQFLVLPAAAKVGGGGVHPSNTRKFPVTATKKDTIFLKFYINL